MKYSTDIVVFDLEASCRSFGSNEIADSNIIEIGAVRLDRKSLAVTGEFSELVHPRDFEILPEITEITGITPQMVADKDEFDSVGARFAEWFGNRNRAILASYGVYYDMPLLRKEFGAFGLDFQRSFVGGAFDIRAIALAWLADNGHRTTGMSVQRTLEKMGIDLGSDWHRALDDAKATAAILQFFHLGEVRL